MKISNNRTFLIIVFGFIFVFLTGACAYASGSFMVMVKDVLGIKDEHVKMLDTEGTEIGVFSVDDNIKIGARSVYGDHNNCIIVFDIDKVDEQPICDNKENDLPDFYNVTIQTIGSNTSGYYYPFDENPDDNKMQYVVSINGRNIQGDFVTIVFNRIGYGLDTDNKDEQRVISDGSWTLHFRLDYKSAIRKMKSLDQLELCNNYFAISNCEISPMSFSYRIKWLSDDLKNQREKNMDNLYKEVEKTSMNLAEVYMKDGSKVDYHYSGAEGSYSDSGLKLQIYYDFDRCISLDDVDFIRIGNVKLE